MSLDKMDDNSTKKKSKISFGRKNKRKAMMRVMKQERESLRMKEQIQGLTERESARLEALDDYYD